jgi:NTE family protein
MDKPLPIRTQPKRAEPMKTHKAAPRPPFECIALVLQGGGALGAYQAGVYQALAEADLHPDWVAGISIGAINSALIAGNPPEQRVERLRAFWEQITTPSSWGWGGDLVKQVHLGDRGRELLNQVSAVTTMTQGAPGFFTPRVPSPQFLPPGSPGATSYYDTTPLRATLESLVDFDRINSGEMRFSVGAVNVRSGNFVYFDNATHHIKPEHIMASGALPPGFPAVEIEGEFYWDGGLISNTPLQWVVESTMRQDTLAFQVDLWSARGEIPGNLAEVTVRQKEITYSSRTRAKTDQFKQMQKLRNAVAALIKNLPPELQRGAEHDLLNSFADRKVYNIVELIYHTKHYEGDSKDYEFSRLSMEDHWLAGYHDAIRTLRHPEVFERPNNLEGVSTFDLARDGRE